MQHFIHETQSHSRRFLIRKQRAILVQEGHSSDFKFPSDIWPLEIILKTSNCNKQMSVRDEIEVRFSYPVVSHLHQGLQFYGVFIKLALAEISFEEI